MAKKATLLKRAQKLGLDVTDANKVPEIQAALDAHAAKQKKVETPVEPTPTPETTAPEAPETPENDEVGAVTSMELNVPDELLPTFMEVLLAYNSINKSRRRWVLNRNLIRNHWKELFEILEKASGRDGKKATVFDENWHVVADKGVISGPVDREADDVKVQINVQGEFNTQGPDWVQRYEELEGLLLDLVGEDDEVSGDELPDDNGQVKGTYATHRNALRAEIREKIAAVRK